jgi:hypothetical protein
MFPIDNKEGLVAEVELDIRNVPTRKVQIHYKSGAFVVEEHEDNKKVASYQLGRSEMECSSADSKACESVRADGKRRWYFDAINAEIAQGFMLDDKSPSAFYLSNILENDQIGNLRIGDSSSAEKYSNYYDKSVSGMLRFI